MTSIRNLDQERAKHAWEAVQSATKLKDDAPKKYGREAKKMPVRIMTAGLGQALAFIEAKAEKHKELRNLHADLTRWVFEGRKLKKAGETKTLLETVIRSDATFLRMATDEVLAYLQWLNRFAEAEGLTDDLE